MNDSKLKSGIYAVGKNQADWKIGAFTEQFLSDLHGAVTWSIMKEMLKDLVSNYKDASIQTIVPLFIRRDAVKRLRTMQAPVAAEGINEADASTGSRTKPISRRNGDDEQDKTYGADLIYW